MIYKTKFSIFIQSIIKFIALSFVLLNIVPAQSVNSCPTKTHSAVSFTVSEDIDRQVLSGTSFGMRDSDRDIINYLLDGYLYGYWGPLFSVRNKNSRRTSGIQYAEITYEGNGLDYETAPVFDDGRRGYRVRLYGLDDDFNFPNCGYTIIEIVVYVTDAPEVSAMSGSISIFADGDLVGDTLTADFSQVSDTEGLNNLSVTWSREACPASRGTGTWPLNRAVKSGSTSYQIVDADRGHKISVWGQYQTDAGHSKWVCGNFRLIPDLPAFVPENNAPYLSYSPVFYTVPENTGSGTLLADSSGRAPSMLDSDQDVISYSISIPEGTDSNTARTIRSIFRVSNTAPNPDSREYKQTIEISYNKSFNYETVPELDYGRGYEFGIKGCDPHGDCDTLTVIVEVEDEIEINALSGSISITGNRRVGETLTADFSGLSDSEGGVKSLLEGGNGYVVWRRGACTASKGIGDLPGNSYQDLSYYHTYTLGLEDFDRIVSVWGSYHTDTYSYKWVCRQTSSIRGNFSWPNISISSSSRTVPAKENIEITLYRPNYLTNALPIHLRSINGNQRKDFTKTIPAGEKQVVFSVEAHEEGELIVEVRSGSGYNPPSSIKIIVTVANSHPSGNPSITGNLRVGETLTANTSSIIDGNGISRSFSYTWWKKYDFGVNANVVEQISGARSSTYLIKSGDVRSQIKVRVSYTDNNGFSETVESSFTTSSVQPLDNDPPRVLNIYLKEGGNEPVVPLGSNFEVPVGRSIWFFVHMSKGVSGISAYNGSHVKLEVGGQIQILDKIGFRGEDSAPTKLVFYYDVQAGDSGPIVFPRNGIFPGDGVDLPNNANFNYPRTHLGNMTVLNTQQQVAEETQTKDEQISSQQQVEEETQTKDEQISSQQQVEEETQTKDEQISSQQQVAEETQTNDEQISSQQQVEEETQTNDEQTDSEVIEIIIISPITARFLSMPSEHDGTNPFKFELRFSEDVDGLSYKTLKNNNAFRVTNGSIKNAIRLVRGANRRWEIVVQPNSTSNITIKLSKTTNCSSSSSICHSDGRKLSNSSSDTVKGPVTISVADVSANEGDVNTIDFTVRLSRSSTRTVTVNYATENGTATSGQDYTSTSGTLTFSAGETSKTIQVSLLDDNIDEGNENFKLKLSSPSGAVLNDTKAVGTIENTDLMPKALLSRFGRTVGNQAVNTISSRMKTRTPTRNKVVIGGVEMSNMKGTREINHQQNLYEQSGNDWQNWNEQKRTNDRLISKEELIHGTSFNLGVKNEETGKIWSVWGEVAGDEFKGEEDDLNLEGKVTSAFLGADFANGNWLGGVAVSSSTSKGNFNPNNKDFENKGTAKSKLTSLYPYLGYAFGENNSVWGIFGVGEGNMTVTQKNQSAKTDISMNMGAVGANGSIFSQSKGDVLDMTVQTDVLFVRMDSEESADGMKAAETDVTRLRLTLDSSKNFKVGRGILTPSLQFGVRHDSGDAEEGIGLEAGSGLHYVSGRLSLKGEIRKLLVHEENKYEEWGANVAVNIDPDKLGRGLSLSVAHSLGSTDSNNIDRLWSAEGLHKLGENENFKASEQFNAEIAYGLIRPFSFFRGLLTPYFNLSLGDNSTSAYRTGTRLVIAPNANLDLELSHTKDKNEEDKVMMLFTGFNW